MEKIVNELTHAFDEINSLMVRGEDAERLVAIKQALRNAYSLCMEKEQHKENGV